MFLCVLFCFFIVLNIEIGLVILRMHIIFFTDALLHGLVSKVVPEEKLEDEV